MGNALDFEIDDELLNFIHQPASLSSGISYQDSLLSMKQKMIVSYDLLDLEGDYGFQQDFMQEEIHGYFRQMNKYANVSMNEIIKTFDYSLEPESKVVASREQNTHNARVYFLVGKFGIVHILYFDPYHEINPI